MIMIIAYMMYVGACTTAFVWKLENSFLGQVFHSTMWVQVLGRKLFPSWIILWVGPTLFLETGIHTEFPDLQIRQH